jgi:hypothetical protein
MATNKLSKGGAGGGPGSRSAARVNTYFTGQSARAQNPGGVAQIGQSQGNHSTDSAKILRGGVEPVRGAALTNHELGNECAVNTVCGPGGSRTVAKAGTNAQHGPVAGTVRPPGRGFDVRGK